jgi:hypothetical protein
MEACEMEAGKLEPFLSVRISQIPGPFIQPSVSQQSIDSQPSFTDNNLERLKITVMKITSIL